MPAWILGGLTALLALLLLASSASSAVVAPTLFPLAPSARALAMTVGPDGNTWFAGVRFASSENTIGRVTGDGQVTEFVLPDDKSLLSGAGSIVSGPDGNLWFTESGANRVGRITASGEIAIFPLPAANSRPNAIAAGPDGNLWFTEGAASKIGRITPAGAITEFPLEPGRLPVGIVTGSDGNLWFAERRADKIGRISVSGVVTEFPLPGSDSWPNAIAAGPDGNLWFTEGAASKIGRITPAGAITQFPVPATGTTAITPGSGGSLWFLSGNRIGSISPSGQVEQMLCLESSCRLPPISLTQGTDENLWFGTSIILPIYSGGGTVQSLMLTEPGQVGSISLPSSSLAIAPPARAVSGRFTDLGLSCTEAAGCTGALRLTIVTKPRPATGSHPRSFGKTLVLAHRQYELAAGESSRLHLRLDSKAMALLSKHGSLSVWATAGVPGHDEAIQSIVLRSNHRPEAGDRGNRRP